MKTTKWYNWVGDEFWDGYCKMCWIFLFGPFLLGFATLMIITIIEALK